MRNQYGLAEEQGVAGQPPATRQEVMRRVPPGAMVEYYSDLAGGLLAPEDMRLEDAAFRVQIDPAGDIVFSTDPILFISRYQFAFRQIVGWAMDPDVVGSAPALVGFNVREDGRNFDVFRRPVDMQSLLSRNGSGNIHKWDGVYITVPGTTMSVEWFVDRARWAALVGAAREFGVQLLGDYVACAPE